MPRRNSTLSSKKWRVFKHVSFGHWYVFAPDAIYGKTSGARDRGFQSFREAINYAQEQARLP